MAPATKSKPNQTKKPVVSKKAQPEAKKETPAEPPQMPMEQLKIIKPRNGIPNDIETAAAKWVLDVENNSDIKQLRELYISSARILEFSKGREVLIIYVPVSLLKKFQAIHVKLIAELEKRVGHYVIILGYRRMIPKPSRKNKIKQTQKRPRSRTLTHVHEEILNDLVYPLEIVGKRIRFKLDGNQLMKIHLDKKLDNEDRMDAFSQIYKKLTGKTVVFEVPEYIL